MVKPQLSTCAVVAIGASAGGLDALRRLLGALPAEPPFAVVVVQHLDPSTRSHLAEIIGHSCELRVKRARSGDRLAAGTVYVVPEGREPFLDEGRLRLKQHSESCSELIDSLFTSLAAHNEAAGCGVLLSGNGSDGVLGLRQIRGAGGMTFAQEPSTAEFPSMPNAAIESGVCDFIGSPEQIARDLMAHVRHPAAGGPPVATRKTKASADRDAKALAKILGLMRVDSGMDFSGYKTTTVTRRVARRALLADAPTLEAYLTVVEDNPAEVAALVDDLLINVTQFFRDPEVFESLRTRVFPEILKSRPEADTLRIWVVGCSTGEEVYSILITALEVLEALGVKRKVTVFGTDASDASIKRARAGAYPPSICSSVSPERLAKYFVRTDAGFEIDRALRDMCVFARQDITKDTPFSRLDVVSLRNVLIYMDQPLQSQVLAVAHFALLPDGVLLLGTSETPETEPRLFRVFDKQNHVYRRQDVASQLPVDVAAAARSNIDGLSIVTPALAFDIDVHDSHTAANEMALLMYAPPRVVVDANGHILHFFGDTAPFLEHAAGRATLDVGEMVKTGIALELKDALQAAKSGDGRATRAATFVSDGRKAHVSIEVTPLPSPPGQAQLMVAFREVAATDAGLDGPVINEDLSRLYESREQRVRGELGAIRGRLRAVAEEKEQVNQSLRSANEEIRSSNEELQSINEELETAKEELQSANEELITVNDELRLSNRELGLANDDLLNFAAGIDIPVLMLDRSLRVRRFTPQATRVVRIEDSDVGRLLEHLRLRVDAADLPGLAAAVIESETPHQADVRDEDGRWYAMSLRPYRSAEGSIDGVVIAFSDIDDLKRSADRLERRARLGDALTAIDADLASTMEIDEIIQRALDQGVAALEADAGTVEMHENGCWVVRYENGFAHDEVGMRLGEADAPNAAAAARLGKPVMIADMSVDPEVNVGFVKSHELKSVLALPLVVHGSVIGCLLFYRRHEARAFSSGEIDFGRRLGTSASLALENSRLLQAERSATRRAETLNAINELIRTALTPADLLGRLVRDVSRVAGADKSLVLEVHGDEFTLTHVWNVRDDLIGSPQPFEFLPAFAIAASERTPLLVVDAWQDPLTNKAFVVPYGLRGLQFLPLLVDDEVVAVLGMAYDEPHVFDDEDIAFSLRLSNAMSVALKNALLYESEVRARLEAKRELEVTTLLQEVTTTATGSLSLSDIGHKVIDALIDRLGASGAAIYAMDETGSALRALAIVGYPKKVAAGIRTVLVNDDSSVGHLALHKLPVLTHESGFVPPVSAERLQRMRGEEKRWAALTIRQGEDVLGAFTLVFDENRPFDESELSVYRSIAELLASAFERAQLFEKEQKRAERLAVLKELAEIGSSTLHVREVADRVAEAVIRLLGATNAVVALADGDRLEPVAILGYPDDFVEKLKPLPADSLAAEAFFSGEARFIDDYAAAGVSRFTRATAKKLGFASFAALPIVVGGSPIGAVGFVWKTARRFDPDEVSFLESVAAEAALGLKNALLFEAEQATRRRVEALHELTELATSSLELSEVADRALHYVHDSLGVDVVTFWLLNDDRSRLYPISGVGFPQEFFDGFAAGVGLDDPFEVAVAVKAGTPSVRGAGHISEVPEPVRASYAEYGVDLQSLLVLPVRGRADVIGAVTLAWRTPDDLDAGTVEFFSSVANELAIATENASLYAAKESELGRTRMLAAVATAASSSLSLNDICEQALAEVRSLPEVAAAAVYVLETDGTAMRAAALFGYPEEMLAAITELPIDDTNNPGRVAGHDLAVLTHEDAGSPPQASERLARIGAPSARWIVLAMKSAGRLVGVLGLTFHGVRSFESRELTLFSGMADTLAGSLANARLFEAEQEAEQRVTSVLESISDGFYALDTEWRFTYANAEAGRMIGVPEADLIGRTMGDALGDPEVQRFQEQAFAPAMESSQVVEFERYFPQTGIWADIRAYPFAEGVAVYGRDITESRVAEEALRQARDRADLMAALLDESSQPFGLGNLDGTMGLVNHAFEQLTGYTAEELADVLWATKLTPPEYVEMEAEMLGRLVSSGETVRYEKEYVRKDGTRVPIELLVQLVRDESGAPRNYYAFVTDLTERKQRDRLDVSFNEIRTAIGRTLEFGEIMEAALPAAAESLGADSAEVLSHKTGEWSVSAFAGEQAGTGTRSTPDVGPAVARIVAAARKPVAIDDAGKDTRLSKGVRRHGVKSVLAAPLGVEGAEIGVMAFYRHAKSEPFTGLQTEFITRLARVVSLAVQNSRLYERERTIAETLQEALLTPPERIDGIESAYLYRAASTTANVGGDFFDVFAIEEHTCVIVVGDVSGKGIGAARLTSLMHDGIRAYALETDEPGQILARLNRLVSLLSPVEQFATVFIGVLDTRSGAMRYCTAGHPPPAVVSADGASYLISTRSPLMGAFPTATFHCLDTVLVPGDRLIAFTDGVTEARGAGQLLGEARLLKILSKMTHTPVGKLPQRLFDKVRDYAEGELRDDTVILSVEMKRSPKAEG